MRIFVLGAGGTGSLLAHLLKRQGHTVWCGDRDPERGRRFLGKNSGIEVVETNARNLWAIVRSGRGANLVVNASPPVYNEIILRAALRQLEIAACRTRRIGTAAHDHDDRLSLAVNETFGLFFDYLFLLLSFV